MKKILLGGIAGGIVFFLLGWLFYGMLFAGLMADNAGTATGVYRENNQMIMWALLLGNLFWGFLFAIIFGSWAKISTAGAGAKAGAIIGLFMGAGLDLIMYGTSNLMTLTGVIADILIVVVMSAICGTIVAMIIGSGKKA